MLSVLGDSIGLLCEYTHTAREDAAEYVRNLHNRLLDTVMSGTIRFFNVTPVGRILNRFSKGTSSLYPHRGVWKLIARYRDYRLFTQLRPSYRYSIRGKSNRGHSGCSRHRTLVLNSGRYHQLALLPVFGALREPPFICYI